MNWQEALRQWIDGGLKTCHPEDDLSETFRAGAEWALEHLIETVTTDENAYGVDVAINMLKKIKEQP